MSDGWILRYPALPDLPEPPTLPESPTLPKMPAPPDRMTLPSPLTPLLVCLSTIFTIFPFFRTDTITGYRSATLPNNLSTKQSRNLEIDHCINHPPSYRHCSLYHFTALRILWVSPICHFTIFHIWRTPLSIYISPF